MSRYRTISVLIALIAPLMGCSKENPAPVAQVAPSQAPAAAPAPSPPVQPSAAAPAPTASPAGPPPLMTGETNITGVAAEVTECARKDGVLSIRVRLRNTNSVGKHVGMISARNYESYYVSAGNKKYFILKDSDGTYLTPRADGFGELAVDLDPGSQYTWWAKFPAPPADVKMVTVYMPIAPPLEDIAISDK